MGGSAVDYFNSFRANATSLRPTISIGYDKYGLIVGGLRASYAVTPTFSVRVGGHARWTAEDVDTAGTVANGTGITPGCPAAAVDNGTCVDEGDASYLGSEVVAGFTWRFAPNVTLDFAAAYFIVGPALSAHQITNFQTGVVQNGRNPQDIQTVATRVRYVW
jgi:long-subunit fatty acid transport protein